MIEIARMPVAPDFAPGKGELLPARMEPLPDELLSSWLVRLAMAHGMKLHSFCVEVFGRKAQIWNRDIDKLADKQVLRVISERTGVDYERVFQTTLAAYAGKIYEKHNPHGNTVWILPIGIYHRKRLRYGLQFCPYCLREDVEPYFRRAWRLSWVVLCERHGILLRDRCPRCENPIVFFRNEMGHKSQSLGYSVTVCSHCETNWTAKKWFSVRVEDDSLERNLQISLKNVIDDGWVRISGFDFVHSIIYFQGLKQILRVLSVCNRSDGFRREIARCSRIPLEISVGEMNFDYLAVERRQTFLRAMAWLLKDFPKRFIEVAKKSATWASVMLPHDLVAPFWYQKIIAENLSRKFIGFSEDEILSALSVLENRHRKSNTPISMLQLQKIMQNNDVMKKKSKEFQRRIHNRIRTYNDSLSV